MNTVTDLLGGHHCAPSELVKVASPSTAQRQTLEAAGQGMPQAPAQKGEGTASGEDLSAAVTQLNDYVQSIQRTLNFSVDGDTGRTVVKVIDTNTEEVIRQIPAENVLSMLKQLAADANGDSRGPRSIFVQDKA